MLTLNSQNNSSFIDMNAVNINRLENSNKIIGPRKNKHFFCIHCGTCLSFFKWFPVIFISFLIVWNYYAFVVQLCLITIKKSTLTFIYIIIFHVLYVMTIWSYFQTIITKSSLVPVSFWLTKDDFSRIMKEATNEAKKSIIYQISREKKLSLSCRTLTGSMRICSKCNLIKPDRAHHCSVCNACILKMDHHCPWINNCVSFSNYKFFILFLGYSFIMCLFEAITSFPYFLMFWSNQLPALEKLDILFLFFFSIMFSVSLFSLFMYHIYLILLNRSTLESFKTPLFTYGTNANAFNLGKLKNFKEVFGNDVFMWPFPIYTSLGNGIEYLSSDEHARIMSQEISQNHKLFDPNLNNHQVNLMEYNSNKIQGSKVELALLNKNDVDKNVNIEISGE